MKAPQDMTWQELSDIVYDIKRNPEEIAAYRDEYRQRVEDWYDKKTNDTTDEERGN